MRIIGIDPSLTATGIATLDECETIITRPGDDLNRLRRIVSEVAYRAYGADLAVIEGLSFGNRNGKSAERGALHWMIRDRLDRDKVPIAVVPPTSRARYATGKGNAGKDAVMIACVQRLPLLVSNNNEADAAILLAMGMDHAGYPLVPMPATHRAALLNIAWPRTAREPIDAQAVTE